MGTAKTVFSPSKVVLDRHHCTYTRAQQHVRSPGSGRIDPSGATCVLVHDLAWHHERIQRQQIGKRRL